MSIVIDIELAGEVFSVTFSEDANTPERLVARDQEGQVRGLPVDQLSELTAIHEFLHDLSAEGSGGADVPLSTGISQLASQLAGIRNQSVGFEEVFRTQLNEIANSHLAVDILLIIGSAARDFGVGLLVGGATGNPVLALGLGLAGALDEAVEIVELGNERATKLFGYEVALGLVDEVLDDSTGVQSLINDLLKINGLSTGDTSPFTLADFAALEQNYVATVIRHNTAQSISTELQRLDEGGPFDPIEDTLSIGDEAVAPLLKTPGNFLSAGIAAAEFFSAIAAFIGDPTVESLEQVASASQEALADALADNQFFSSESLAEFRTAALNFPLFGSEEGESIIALADDQIVEGQNNQIFGLAGPDNIDGTDGNDVIEGGLGVDIIFPELGQDTIILDPGAGDIVVGPISELLNDTIVNPGGNKLQIEFPGPGQAPTLDLQDFIVIEDGDRFLLGVDVNGDLSADLVMGLESPVPVVVSNVTNFAGIEGEERVPPATIVEFAFPAGFTIDQPLSNGLASLGPASLGIISQQASTSEIGSTNINDGPSDPELRNLAVNDDGRIFTVLEYDAGENLAFGLDNVLPPQFPGDAGGVIVELDPATGAFIPESIRAFAFGNGGTVPNTPPDFGINSVESINALAPLGSGEFLAVAEFRFSTNNPIRTLEGGTDFAFKINTQGETEFLVNWSIFGDGEATRTVSADTSPVTGEVFAWQDNVNGFGGGTLLRVDRATGEPAPVANFSGTPFGNIEITAISFEPDGTLIGLGGEILNGVIVPRVYEIDPVADTITARANLSGQFFPEEFDLTGEILPQPIRLGSASSETIQAITDGEQIDAGPGDDTILINGLSVRATGGDGADDFVIDAGNQTGVSISDLTLDDQITILGVTFTLRDIQLTLGSIIVDIDTDQDGTADTSFTLEGDFPETQEISVEEDGEGNTVIRLVDANEPPIADPDSATTDEDTPVAIDVLENDSDPDAGALSIVGLTDPANGSVFVDANGEIIYQPALNFSGNDSFTYEVADPSGLTATGEVTVEVSAVNDAPIALADSAATDDRSPILVDVLANDLDPDGDALTLLNAAAETGTADVEDGLLRYIPTIGFEGLDEVTYQVSDGNGGRTTGFAFVRVAANAVPDPVLSISDAEVDEGNAGETSLTFVASLDVTAPAEVTFDATISLGSAGANDLGAGTQIGAPQQFSIPEGDSEVEITVTIAGDIAFEADETFNIALSNLIGAVPGDVNAIGTILNDDAPPNGAPIAVDDSFDTIEDESVSGNVLANDEDPEGDDLAASLVDDVSNGELTLNGDGSFDYTPDADFNGEDSFTYEASDGNGGTAAGTVTVTVLAVDDAPVAVDDTGFSTPFNTALVIAPADLTANDDDGDPELDQPLTVIAVGEPMGGTVELVGGAIVFTPTEGFSGAASFEYTLSDGSEVTDVATVSSSVGENAPPEVQTSLPDVASDEDQPVLVALPEDAFVDLDGDELTLTATLADGEPLPSWLIFDGSTFSGTPPQNFNGTLEIEVTASDGLASASDLFELTIRPVPDDPVALDDVAGPVTAGESLMIPAATLLDNDSDVDGDELTLQSVQNAIGGVIELDGTDAVFTADADFEGTASFAYTVSDGTGRTDDATVEIVVEIEDDEPGDINIIEATPDREVFTATDAIDRFVYEFGDSPSRVTTDRILNFGAGDQIDLSDFGFETFGSSGFSPTNLIVRQFGEDVFIWNAPNDFQLRILDASQTDVEAGLIFERQAEGNRAPQAEDDGVRTSADTPILIDVLRNDRDADEDPLTVTGVSNVVGGTAEIGEDNFVTFSPDPDFVGDASFEYQISDGNGGTDSAFVNVTVEDVPPEFNAIEAAPGGELLQGTDALDSFVFEPGDSGTSLEADSIAGFVSGDRIDLTAFGFETVGSSGFSPTNLVVRQFGDQVIMWNAPNDFQLRILDASIEEVLPSIIIDPDEIL